MGGCAIGKVQLSRSRMHGARASDVTVCMAVIGSFGGGGWVGGEVGG